MQDDEAERGEERGPTSCNTFFNKLVEALCLEVVWLPFDKECCKSSWSHRFKKKRCDRIAKQESVIVSMPSKMNREY